MAQVYSAFHPSGVDKSRTTFGWGCGGDVTSVGWQVKLCDPIWHASYRGAEAVVTALTRFYVIVDVRLRRRHEMIFLLCVGNYLS